MKIGKKIKKLRKQKKLSLDELAILTKTSKSYLSDLETNASSNPTLDKLIKISKGLKIKVESLIK